MDRATAAAASVRPGIRGWLVLIALGVWLEPFAHAASLWKAEAFSQEAWEFSPRSPEEWLSFVGEPLESSFLLIFSSFILFAFLRKHQSLPRLMIWRYVVAQCSLLFLVLAEMAGGGASFSAALAGMPIYALVSVPTLIFIPYFTHSKRVAATFVHGLPQPLPPASGGQLSST
ncbi:MAG: DUF2569 domain-containing protein [Verrucomicrobia bacterium]|nr:DUF2569 domain-containing protein [Verrucomicrobiota bacterium]